MNWPVLKDKKWLVLQAAAVLLSVIGVVLAAVNSSYWVPFVVISVLLLPFAVNRAVKLSK